MPVGALEYSQVHHERFRSHTTEESEGTCSLPAGDCHSRLQGTRGKVISLVQPTLTSTPLPSKYQATSLFVRSCGSSGISRSQNCRNRKRPARSFSSWSLAAAAAGCTVGSQFDFSTAALILKVLDLKAAQRSSSADHGYMVECEQQGATPLLAIRLRLG
jgi:hypothetical protein